MRGPIGLSLYEESDELGTGPSTADPQCDRKAIRAVEKRCDELGDLIREADLAGRDPGGLEHELKQCDEYLQKAKALGGRIRSMRNETDKARSKVSKRIRDAIGAIEAALPSLAKHLRDYCKLGRYCRYDPPKPIDWEL